MATKTQKSLALTQGNGNMVHQLYQDTNLKLFTLNREQLRAVLEQQGKTTPDKVFISQWKKLHVIEEIEKEVYQKVKS